MAELLKNLKEALYALPHYFESPIAIQGLPATDLFSVNTLLGGAIEEQTVRILNNMRNVWDPDGAWFNYKFIRFPESFPDVRLVKSQQDESPAIGIELKGWYLLSKEAEPSFRYKASADAVTEYDMIACFPWALSEVLSGVPAVFNPYIEQAKYASDMRTYYWENRKGVSEGRSVVINHPQTTPYPKAGTKYADEPEKDGGGNFGRIARIPGLMDDWVKETIELKLSGIEAKYWISFLSAFTEGKTDEDKAAEMQKLIARIQKEKNITEGEMKEILSHLETIFALLKK